MTPLPPCPPVGNGFPEGYFTIKCPGSQGRVLDVRGGDVADGAEIIIYKDKTHKFRKSAQNQLFFVDKHGTLRSKASGHAVGYDSKGHRLVLRKSPHADLPKFSYCERSREVLVRLPGMEEKPYLMAALPMAAPKDTKVDVPHVVEALGYFGLSPGFPDPEKLTAHNKSCKSLVDDDEIGGEADVDDHHEKMREVRIIQKDDKSVRDRRQWEVKVIPESWAEWTESLLHV
ncbi:hypothetical protein VNI00_002142 [Paramarasmius palmivorus]|uniref:Uncharacterized protein n=1 Tax=Paramarasmius palmivorus TaxID=297713 RepID=A0AAW0E0Z8_9AGAR